MISFCGYSFVSGKDVLNPMPTNININSVKIQNGVFDGLNATRDTSFDYEIIFPKWGYDSIFISDFKNSGLNISNIDFTFEQLTSIKIKRRKKGDFKWTTINEIKVDTLGDLSKLTKDFMLPSLETFEWALVPILNGIEGDYIVGSLTTEFNGVFITDLSNNFKLDKNVGYGNRASIQSIGQVIPLGRKYPVIIKNGKADYETGSINGMLLGEDYDNTHEINRKDIVEQINKFSDFLKNGKPKIIKDWNGSIWMAMIIGNPSVTYNNSYGMGIATVGFEWVEQGKYDNEDDLYDNGFIDINIQ